MYRIFRVLSLFSYEEGKAGLFGTDYCKTRVLLLNSLSLPQWNGYINK